MNRMSPLLIVLYKGTSILLLFSAEEFPNEMIVKETVMSIKGQFFHSFDCYKVLVYWVSVITDTVQVPVVL